MKTFSKLLILGIIGLLLFAYKHYELSQYVSLESIKAQQAALEAYSSHHPFFVMGGFVLIYILVAALAIPVAAPLLTLLGGALFGLVLGTALVSVGSTVGATIAFLISRFFLRDFVQNKFGSQIKTMNEGVEKDGASYLFALRLLPLFPFFAINLIMGLTPMGIVKFFFVSQLGMLLGTAVYVNAGTQLAQLESLSGILSPKLIFSFALLGLLPFLIKKIMAAIKNHKIMGKFKKPKTFDYNMIVIGAGSAGLVSAFIAAAVKAKVALIEKNKMGGDCLNTGCVPSKALIRSAKMLSYAKRAQEFGLNKVEAEFDFSTVMERVQNVIAKIEPHDSVARYSELGVECIQGAAMIKDPYRVEVNGQILTTRNIVIATGAGPLVPPFPGLDKIKYWTTDNIWNMRHLPKRLLLIGGDLIGNTLSFSVLLIKSHPSHFWVRKGTPRNDSIIYLVFHWEQGIDGHIPGLMCRRMGKLIGTRHITTNKDIWNISTQEFIRNHCFTR